MFVVDRQVPVIIIGISLCEDLDNIIPNQIFNSRLITYYIEGYVLMQKIKHYQTYLVVQTCIAQIHLETDSKSISQGFLINKKLTVIDVN